MSYDALNRLVGVDYGNGTVITYTYDAAGNMLSRTVVAPTAPGAPTQVVATAGDGQITVTFLPPASNGGSAITQYTVTCGTQSASALATTITVANLSNGVAYTCTVTATNIAGTGVASAPSNSVTPQVSLLPQVISFAALTNRAIGSPPFAVSATGGASGNPVVFTSQTPLVCSTSGSNGTLVTLLSAGTCTVAASQVGNATYAAATPVSRSFTVTGLFRAYLSRNGSDTNPCSLQQPCRLLPAALAAVNPGGEVWMLDSANFNSATVAVNKSVTILAVPGALGSIVANASNAIQVSSDPGIIVTLRNVVILNLAGAGNTGVSFTQGNQLTLEGCEIYGLGTGIAASAPDALVALRDTTIRESSNLGVSLTGNVTGLFDSVALVGNASAGIAVQGAAQATIASSLISGGGAGIRAIAGTGSTVKVSISETEIAANAVGLEVTATAVGDTVQVVIGDSTVAANGTGVSLAGAGARTVFTRQNSTFKFNGTDVQGGALTPSAAQ